MIAMRIKIKIIGCIGAMFLMNSCSLDLPVEDQITGMDAIDNLPIAEEALASVYLSIPKNKLLFSKLADDFYPTYHLRDHIDDYRLYQWNIASLALESNVLWREYYTTIMKANVLLQAMENITVYSDKEQRKYNIIKAEAISLKAISYYELLQLYAPTYTAENASMDGIILKNTLKSQQLKRSNLDVCYKEINKLLLQAVALFPENYHTKFHFSQRAAYAMLSKVNLDCKKYTAALDYATEVLVQQSLSLTDVSGSVYIAAWEQQHSSNKEILFSYEEDSSYYTEIFNSSELGDYYMVNPHILFDDTDYRKGISLLNSDFRTIDGTLVEVSFLGKYRTDYTLSPGANILALRTAEMYFIQAEAQVGLGQYSAARATVQHFLKLRNSSTLILVDDAHLLEEILKEKQREFFGEGLRYFDLKRYQKNVSKVHYKEHAKENTIKKSDFRWLFPIPKDEIRNNTNIRQNPGWNPYI